MRPLQACLLALLLAFTSGCPDPTPEPRPPAAPGEGGGDGGGAQDPPADGRDGPPAGGGEGGDGPAQGRGDAGGGDLPEWEVIPAAHREAIYPVMQPLASWPDPGSLRPLSQLEPAAAPDPTERQLLEQLVALVIAPQLRPTDFDAALGVDGEGRLFVKLGKTKASGSASLNVELEGGNPVFGLVVRDEVEEKPSVEQLVARVSEVVVPELARELRGPDARVHPSPQVKGPEGVALLAMLDRAGAFGIQFPYLYAYGTPRHVAVLLQEVPHESGMPAPR